MKVIEKEQLNIVIPALKRPSIKELQKQWSWIKEIGKDTSPKTATSISLGTVLQGGETYLAGFEYEKRRPDGLLGYQHAQWLVEHQDEFPEFMALLGKVYIDFPGLIVVGDDGSRDFPCLFEDGGRWELDWDWADGGLSPSGRIAASRKVANSDSQALGTQTSDFLTLGSRISALEKTVEKLTKIINLP